MHEGLPLVEPELAWLQLAEELSRDELVIAGDHLVRRKRPLSTLDRLENCVESAAGARGIRLARAAVCLVRLGTDSPPETWLRLLLLNAGLPEPLVGFTVHHQGYFVGTPDLAYPDEKIAIEYQGGGHRDADVFDEDVDRLERFHDAGWLVIQVTKSARRDPERLIARVAWHLKSRAQR